MESVFDSTTKRPTQGSQVGRSANRYQLSAFSFQLAAVGYQLSVAAGAGPGRHLHGLRNRAEALVDELLQALAGVGFRRVEVALRVDGDAVHAEEHAGLTAAIPEAVELGHRLAVIDTNVFVRAVRHVK